MPLLDWLNKPASLQTARQVPYRLLEAVEHYDDNLEHSQWLSMVSRSCKQWWTANKAALPSPPTFVIWKPAPRNLIV